MKVVLTYSNYSDELEKAEFGITESINPQMTFNSDDSTITFQIDEESVDFTKEQLAQVINIALRMLNNKGDIVAEQ